VILPTESVVHKTKLHYFRAVSGPERSRTKACGPVR
jgi:hypothetical protein